MWRWRFMPMNAPTCTKPGYTRRPAPLSGSGTQEIRLRSNHSIDLLVASVFTAVGLMRQSIGPAISVRLAGTAGSSSSDISAVAASAATHGWQIATRCEPGPMRAQELHQVLGVLLEPEAARRAAGSRARCASR